jgi:NAD(P)-dependent dehydrogenase (short-subunit alcohol dehydrogenase family)
MDLGLKDVHVLVTGLFYPFLLLPTTSITIRSYWPMPIHCPGANGGIGFETTRLFLSLGANVTAHYNSSSSALQPLYDEYGPSRILLAQADLTSEEAVASLFKSSSHFSGPVQVVVINHGIWPSDSIPLHEMSLTHWNRTINTNLTSPFLVAREFLRYLADSGAGWTEEKKNQVCIVFVGSAAGKIGEATHADYSSSKSGESLYGSLLSYLSRPTLVLPSVPSAYALSCSR